MMTKKVVDNISMKQLTHFAQLVRDGRFAMYNYGTIENRKRYKSDNSPEYNLTLIEVPITVIYGSKDALVSPTVDCNFIRFVFIRFDLISFQDVELFISKISNVHQTLKMPWNHLDFIFGKDVDVRINDYIIRGIKEEA